MQFFDASEVKRTLDAGTERALRVGKGPTRSAHVLPEQPMKHLRPELEIALPIV